MTLAIHAQLLIFELDTIVPPVQCVLRNLDNIAAGDAGREEGHGRAVRDQDTQEGHHHPGRRHRLRHDREEGPGPVPEAALPCPASLLLPNHGKRWIMYLRSIL